VARVILGLFRVFFVVVLGAPWELRAFALGASCELRELVLGAP
jgi:hypothetical protein